MSAPTTAEVRGAMEQAAAAEQALAMSDAAATAFCAVRTVLECIALPIAEHRDALAAEVETLRYRSLELSVVEERCDWEPTVAPKWDEDGNERDPSDRVEDLVDALRASRAEAARLREALEKRYAAGHNDTCAAMLGDYACSCGHDGLLEATAKGAGR